MKLDITLEQFRATGVDIDDLGTLEIDDHLTGVAGRTYLGTLYVQSWIDDRHGIAPPNGPTWLLILGNLEQFGPLADMELELYQWACDEGYCDFGGLTAGKFAELLRKELNGSQWEAMRRANVANASNGICASHDYCDANMHMAEAFESVAGYAFDPRNDEHCAIWNQAWDIAHRRYLTEESSQ